MHVGNRANIIQSSFEFEERVNSDLDAAPDIVRNANKAIDWALAHRTSLALATDSPPKNEEVATRQTFISNEQGDSSLSSIMNLPLPQPHRAPTATLHALQEWEGYVIEIGDKDFTARLVDLTTGASCEQEEAVIPLVEISEEDIKKMRPGSIFRWVIGYERLAVGKRRRRVSEFVFRDLPAFTESDLRDGETWADDIMKSLDL